MAEQRDGGNVDESVAGVDDYPEAPYEDVAMSEEDQAAAEARNTPDQIPDYAEQHNLPSPVSTAEQTQARLDMVNEAAQNEAAKAQPEQGQKPEGSE